MNWHKLAHLSEDAGQQEGWTDVFGDVQRYALDAYRCQVFLNKTGQKTTVALTVAHDMFGLVVFQEYWKYDLGDTVKARTTFSKVKTAVKEIFSQFEASETPNAMLHTAIREAVRYIDPESKPSTRNPSIDAARTHSGESDWRSTIYGTRYPRPEGF